MPIFERAKPWMIAERVKGRIKASVLTPELMGLALWMLWK
jgi:hypothetical protein